MSTFVSVFYSMTLHASMDRHASFCRPGCWMVWITSCADVGVFRNYSAVVDDFGTLVEVA